MIACVSISENLMQTQKCAKASGTDVYPSAVTFIRDWTAAWFRNPGSPYLVLTWRISSSSSWLCTIHISRAMSSSTNTNKMTNTCPERATLWAWHFEKRFKKHLDAASSSIDLLLEIGDPLEDQIFSSRGTAHVNNFFQMTFSHCNK